MKKWVWTLLAVLFVSSALAGCSSSTSSSSSSGGKVAQEITLNALSEPPSLDPALASDTTSGWVLDHTFEGLYTKDQKGNPVLGQAKSVKESADGKTYTFTLRDDAKWSDGTPVTAQDFEYAWKRVLDPKTGSPFAFYMYYIQGAQDYNKGKGNVNNVGIKALDNKTLQVTLTAPLSYFKELLTFWVYYPVKQDLVSKNPNWAANAAGYVSNGPFKLTDWKHDSQVVVQKNDNYYDKNVVNLNKITWKMVNDANTYYQMYKTGQLDMIDSIPPDIISQVKNENDFKETPYFGTYMYMFNVKKAPFNNAKIREAFNLAIDRQALVQNVTKAGETPAYSMVPSGVKTPSGDFRKVGGDYVKENVAQAKKLLKEGMAEEHWTTLPQVTLLYNTLDANKTMAEAVQQMIKQNLGVNLQLENQEWKTYLATTQSGDFQMARMGWIGVLLDPAVILDYYLGDSPNNRTGWVNPQYDSLMAQAKAAQDPNKHFQLLHQAEDVLMKDLPFMPVYFYTQTYLTSPKFTGIVYPYNRYPNLKWAKKTSN